jgi:secreted trypsin-like serine protease
MVASRRNNGHRLGEYGAKSSALQRSPAPIEVGFMKRLAVCALIIGVIGCVQPEDQDEKSICSAVSGKVYGGQSCDQSARSSVVAIVAFADDGSKSVPLSLCTGALISTDAVLTAGHCVVKPPLAAEQKGMTFAGYMVFVGGPKGEQIQVKSVAVHPGYSGAVGDSNDLGILFLKQAPSPSVKPLSIVLSESADKGTKLSSYGYGRNEEGTIGELKAVQFKISAVQGLRFLVEGDGKESLCPGDSGGPSLVKSNSGVMGIAAVTSFGEASGCSSSAAQAWGLASVQSGSNADFITTTVPKVSVR